MMHPLRRQARIRDLRGPVYLLLVVGIAWTAIQNLNDLDPSGLLALWSSGDRSSPHPSAAPATTVVSQTHYPFQPAPGEATSTATTPAPPTLATEKPPSTPVDASRPAAGATSPPAPATPAAPTSSAEPAALAATPSVMTATVAATSSGAGSTLEGGGHSAAEARLLLEFSNDCWVEVKDSQGNVLANGLMKANSTRTISGSAPFKVTLGNAPATRIILDDRLVNTEFYVPRRGTVSRFTLDRGQP
jgi:cytoskeleton protein RodZ